MRWSAIDRARLALPLSVVALGVAAVVASPAVAASDPPPGRAYELVSLLDDRFGVMAGLSTDMHAMPGRSSEDGDALIFGGGSSLGSNWSGPTNPMIFGRRTATGWEARTATRSMDEGDTPLELNAHESRSGWLTSDGSEFVFGVAKPLGGPPTGGGLGGVYRTLNAVIAPEWLSQPAAGIPTVAGVDQLNIAAGDDNRTVAFASNVPLTADAPPAGTSAVYVRRDGELELVSRLPDGSPAMTYAILGNGGGGRTPSSLQARVGRNQVAGNGRFVLFVVGDALGGALYVRDLEQGVTRQLAGGGTGAPNPVLQLRAWSGFSVDAQTVPAGTVFGARDGARAFFATDEGAGSVSGWEADLETGVVTARPEITGPPLSLSRDGERMLFVAPPSSGTAVGDWTLRFWDAANPGTSTEVGTIAVTGSNPFGFAQGYEPSADGETWVFAAQGSLDPVRPNATPSVRQLYVWNVGDSAPTCLSCEPTDGVARTSGPNLAVQEAVSSEYHLAPTTAMGLSADPSKMAIAQPSHSVSEDGRWLLFDSPDRLVAEDVNNVRDVYLWDRDGGPGGELQLVTRGVGASPAYALDLDPTGRNAFFTTRDALLAADTDGAYDVYTARIGGGFPDDVPGSCGGEACRPSVSAPGGPVIGSVAFAGRGNASTPARASVSVSGLKAVTGSAARIRVRVPGAGRLSVAGASIKGAGKSAGKAGTYTVRVALKPGARKTLARRERLRVAVRVSYRSASGQRVARTVRITFKAPKQPAKAGRKGGR